MMAHSWTLFGLLVLLNGLALLLWLSQARYRLVVSLRPSDLGAALGPWRATARQEVRRGLESIKAAIKPSRPQTPVAPSAAAVAVPDADPVETLARRPPRSESRLEQELARYREQLQPTVRRPRRKPAAKTSGGVCV